MKKKGLIILVYFLYLVTTSILCNWMNMDQSSYTVFGKKYITPFVISAIVGGIVALKLIVSPVVFKWFLIIYISLWAIQLVIMAAGEKIGPIQIYAKEYDAPAILNNYLSSLFRLEKPMPFLLCLLADYLVNNRKSKLSSNSR